MKKPTPVFSLTSAPPCAALVLALALATSACQPGGVATSTTPAPQSTVYHCGNINETCSKADFDKFEEKRKLAEQAEQVYRAAWAETQRLSAENITPESSEILARLTDGEFRTRMNAVVNAQRSAGRRSVGVMEVSVLSTTADAIGADARISLETCDDGRKIEVLGPDGAKLGKGGLGLSTTDFKVIDGHLKAIRTKSKQVESCGR